MSLTLHGKKPPLILEAHLTIEPKKWKFAKSSLATLLTSFSSNKSFLPLYFSYDFEDYEMRPCFLIYDLADFNNFILNKIRKIPGLTGLRIRLTLDGFIFPHGFQPLLKKNLNDLSVHIFLKVSPSFDASIWHKLKILKKENLVYPTWVFRDFYEYDRDITLRVIGPNLKCIKSYIQNHLNVSGIESIKFKIMQDMVTIMPRKDLIFLARSFI